MTEILTDGNDNPIYPMEEPVSKVMERLKKLEEFDTRGAAIRARAQAIQNESQNLDVEFTKWLETELGLKGNHHISEILKIALETSFEPSRIITP